MSYDLLIAYFISQNFRVPFEKCTFSTHDSFSFDSFNSSEFYNYLEHHLKDKNSIFQPFFKYISKPVNKIYYEISKHISYCYENNIQIIDVNSPYYPKHLNHIDSNPILLNVKGNYRSLNEVKCISIIGSRQSNRGAFENSFISAQTLSSMQYTIVSGGALGCDTYAHKGALSIEYSYFPTISVLAGGLGCLYPFSNYLLFDEILEKGGALVSENFHDYKMKPYDFPIRNRIISGFMFSSDFNQRQKEVR